MRRRLLLCVLALAAGCSEGTRVGRAVVVRDSVGIAIVENRRPAWDGRENWRLAGEPTLSIGTVEGDPDYQLFRVVGAHRLSDGRIVVATAGTNEVRYYDAKGRFLNASGRAGAGPGEFAMLFSTTVAGDTVFAYDLMAQRISVLEPNGSMVASISLAEPGTALPPRVIGRFQEGSWVAARTEPPTVSSGLVRESATYHRIRNSGAGEELIGRFVGNETLVERVAANATGHLHRQVPYGRRASAAVRGNTLVYGSADRFELTVHDLQGRLETVIRLARRPERIRKRDLRAWEEFDETRRSSLPASFPEMLRRPASEVPRPATKAAHGTIRVDEVGNLWVADYSFPNREPREWAIFDATGRWLGKVVMPERFRVLEIGDRHMLGVFRDELEVEHVRMYELSKR